MTIRAPCRGLIRAFSTERRLARLKEKQSLLAAVTEETAKLRRSLGAPDRAILDE